VAGSLDSGKSTLVAVLTNGQKGRPLLDNGQGSARMNVFKHKHEIESGRTSSLSHHMLAYDGDHGVLNYAGVAPMMPSEIASAANKVPCFLASPTHHHTPCTSVTPPCWPRWSPPPLWPKDAL
jgi:GTPase